MKRLTFIVLCLLPLAAMGQEPERLLPLRVHSLTPVPKDTTRYERNSPEWFEHIMDSPRIDFYECHGDTGVVGYLMKTDDSTLRASFETKLKGKLLDNAWLPEIQWAEDVLAEVLNLKADSAQRIAEVFTAPRSYRFIRQYLFYTNKTGDTCVFVNCLMGDDFWHPERSLIDVCDGGDNYWQVKLNLTQRRLLHNGINGPSITFVNGRSKEPHGLDRMAFFGWMGGSKKYFDCSYHALPKAVRRNLPKEYRIDGMTDYDGFKYKGKSYYTVHYSDKTEIGFDRSGHMLYLYRGDSISQDELARITGNPQVYDAIVKDMAARGRDFPRYGQVRSVELVKNCFLVEIIYYPSEYPDAEGNANDMYARYTIDKKGRVIGITH